MRRIPHPWLAVGFRVRKDCYRGRTIDAPVASPTMNSRGIARNSIAPARSLEGLGLGASERGWLQSQTPGNWFKCGRDSDESRPHAGTFTEASKSNRPTIKQINALVTSEAHGQPWVRDSSHRVCMSHLSSDASAETDQPIAIGGRSAKVLALV